MPQLMVFAACEKVIISQDENNPTLIALLNQIGASITVADGVKELPATAAVSMRWNVFSLWKFLPGDAGKTFFAVVSMDSPSKRKWVTEVQEFPGDNQPFVRLVLALTQFPVSESGEWTLRLSLGEKGGAPAKEVATYPLLVTAIIEQKRSESGDSYETR